MAGLSNLAVMFTDLVDSTPLAGRLGPEGAERVRHEHFVLLRAVVDQHEGREVKNLGDGLMVTFGAPSAAVAAAIEVQQRLERRNRTAASGEELVVRIGISVGEVDVDGDGDVFGMPVVQAARVCGAAEGGQVLVTAVVPILVGGRGGFAFTSLGVRELKGLDAPSEVLEVGWEPLPDVHTAPVVPLPARLMRATSVFAGRDDETAALRSAWESACEGALGVAVVSGEAGIGKTTLVGELARTVAAEGAIVLHGGCEERLGVSFRPWIELLEHLVQHLPDDVVSAHLDDHGPHLGLLIPGLGRGREPTPRAGEDLEAERYLVFRAAADLLDRAAAVAPVLLVVEDVHWADVPSLQLLRHLLTVGGERVLVVLTSRSTDVDASGPLPETLAAVHRSGASVTTIELGGLAGDQLLALMEAAAGHPLEADGLGLRDALAAETGGNPFFVVEILRHLAESGAIARGPDERWSATIDLTAQRLPVNVRQVVEQRVARLGPTVERVLRTAAVVGREIDIEVLATVLDVDDDAVVDALDASVDASLVVADGPDRVRFAHALVARILYDSLTPPRRARIHRRVADVLSGHPGATAAERARHLVAGGSTVDAARLVACAVLAGDEAMAALAPGEAVHWYRTALDHLATPATADHDTLRRRCEVMIALGDAERQAGEPEYRDRLLDAARIATGLGADDLLVAAALANHRGFTSRAGQVDHERVAVLESAIDAVGTEPTPNRARLLATLCSELAFGDRERAAASADEAIRIAEASGDARAYADVVALTTFAHSVPWSLGARHRHTASACDRIDGVDDPIRRWRVHGEHRIAQLMACDRGGATRSLEVMREIVDRLPMPYLRHVTNLAELVEAVLDGDLRGAETFAGRAFESAFEAGQPDALPVYGSLLYVVSYHEGRSGEYADEIEKLIGEMPGISFLNAGLAAAHLQAGDPERARAAIGDVVAAAAALERDFLWASGLAVLGDVALGLGDVEAAQFVRDALAPYAEQMITQVLSTDGVVAHRLGCLSALIGRHHDAVRHLEGALEQHRRLRAPIYVAMSAVELSRLLADVDASRSAALADEAEQIRADHGLAGYYGITGRWPLVGRS